MEISSVIVHSLHKDRGAESVLQLREAALSLESERTLHFVSSMSRIYGKSSKDYGVFDPNRDTYPFQGMLTDHVENGCNFVQFTHRAARHFKEIIDREALATSGYVVFGRYRTTSDYLIVVMLNDKAGYAIDHSTLDIVEAIYLDLDKIDVACFVNLHKWRGGEETYLSFAKGKKDISQYFLEFMGCTDRKPSRESSEKLVEALDAYLETKDLTPDEKQEVKEKVAVHCEETMKRGDPIELRRISFVVNEDEPEEFAEFASSDEYGVSSSFDGHKNTIIRLQKISYKGKDLSINFSRHLVDRTIHYEQETNRIIITDVPQELAQQFQG